MHIYSKRHARCQISCRKYENVNRVQLADEYFTIKKLKVPSILD